MTVSVERTDPDAGAEAARRAEYDLWLVEQDEEFRGDPVSSWEAWRSEKQHRPSWLQEAQWYAWDPSHERLLGYASLELEYRDTNRHLAWFRIYVHPEHRRRGVARTLLRHVVEAAAADGRTVLGAYAIDPGDGVGFLEAVGAARKATERQSRLVLGDVDREMLEGWVRRAKERASEYSLLAWDDRTPDEHLDRWLKVIDVMNTAPRDDLDMEDRHHTAETWREGERVRRARGQSSWAVVAVHEPTGDFAGFTDISFSPHHPNAAWQMGTAVDPAHRDKGIGRWLKAVNCLRLLDERPEIAQIDTWNAFSNDAMLGINIAMGYRLVRGYADYQAPIGTWQAFAAG